MAIEIPNKIYFVGTPEEKNFLHALKPLLNSVSAGAWFTNSILTASQVIQKAKEAKATAIVTSHPELLKRIYPNGISSGTISDFAGSMIVHQGMEFLIIDPLYQSRTVPYWEFITRKFLEKFTKPSSYTFSSKLQYALCLDPIRQGTAVEDLAKADYIAFDIETVNEPTLRITMVGFTGIYLSESTGTELCTRTFVIPFTDMVAHEMCRRILQNPVEKIAQNGKYDIAWLQYFGIPVYNYLWDTINLSHCIYSELPKDLAFISCLWTRDTYNWKSLGRSADSDLRFLYNGKDTLATALTFMNILHRYPTYAKKNYITEFPLVFPAHMCEMTGIRRDMPRLRKAQSELEIEIETKETKLHACLGFPLNVISSPQKIALLKGLGFSSYKSADDKHLKRAALQHPLYAHLFYQILDIVKLRKRLSTYLKEGKEFHERILYALNPHGTDTGRLASKEHHFWCGLQLQNIPRGKSVKQTLRADDGFLFNEADLEQAESRDTAFIAGCENLISAVSGTRDFHSVNASAFFGVPYDQIRDDDKKETINKDLRDLAKRVNHGANYNMGPDVLIDTMGLPKIYEAQKLLKLPEHWSPRQVAEHLLSAFHKTYPELQQIYYKRVIKDVTTTKKLVGATGWTRYCFGNPVTNKLHLNSYIAHNPQSLNAQKLNIGFMKIFWTIMMNPEVNQDIIVFGQIHDSVPHQVREGKEYLSQLIVDCMQVPLTITGADGKERTYTVPAALKHPALYWSDCE